MLGRQTLDVGVNALKQNGRPKQGGIAHFKIIEVVFFVIKILRHFTLVLIFQIIKFRHFNFDSRFYQHTRYGIWIFGNQIILIIFNFFVQKRQFFDGRHGIQTAL